MATRKTGEIRRANPNRAATDPRAAAQQKQIKRDHDKLEASARRVAKTTGAAEPRAATRARTRSSHADPAAAATDPRAAAQQDRIKRDHDRLEASARRVRATAGVTEDPEAARKTDRARRNADAARASAKRVKRSTR